MIAPIEGDDRLDTLARQAAALGIVSGLIKERAGARYYADANYPSPDEQRVLDSFSAASTAVHVGGVDLPARPLDQETASQTRWLT